MSYILDALKNSDKERKKGSVPDLQSRPDRLLPTAPTPVRPESRVALVGIALLALLAVVVAVWLVAKTEITDSAAPGAPAVVAEPETSPAVIAAPPAEAEESPASLSVDDDYLDELRDVRLDVAPIMEDEALESPAPEPVAMDPPGARTEEPPTESVPAPEPKPIDPVEANLAEATITAAVADPYAGISHQYQLPSEVQRALPELDITVHIYSATPSARLVRINNRNYQEGDLVDERLRLEEITQDGLILTFGDNRYWRYVN